MKIINPYNFGSNRRSLLLNGTSQYMSIADDNSLSFGNASTDSPFSITAWIKLTSATSFPIFNKVTSGSNLEYAFATDATDKLVVFLFDLNSSNYIKLTYSTAMTPYVNTWVHVAMTYDGSGSLTLYVDAVDISGTPSSSGTYVAMHNTTSTVHVGYFPTLTYGSGLINRVVIWDKELSSAEVNEDYGLIDLTSHSAYGNIVSWWSFDVGNVSGATVLDLVGSNDGTLINSPTISTDVPI